MDLNLKVVRFKNGEHAALGNLLVDGEQFCRTLEDVVRDLKADGSGKIPSETAIPAGKYEVTIDMSPKFQKLLPRLHGVKFFTGILIHSGNTDEDTRGCILVGDEHQGETIKRGTARPAFKRLFEKIQEALDAGNKVWIEVVDDFPEPKKGV